MPSARPTSSASSADVRLRVKELAKREYAREGDRPTVDYVLLFLPNEQLTGFIHEHDPGLLDEAMAQRVVMCSPLTLFAFLGVIRQAFDNFMIEQTSDEILQLIGKFGQQWQKYTESAAKVKDRLDSVQREFDQLVGTRRAPARAPAAAAGGAARAAQPPRRRRAVRATDAARQRPRARRLTTGVHRVSGACWMHVPGRLTDRRTAAARMGGP